MNRYDIALGKTPAKKLTDIVSLDINRYDKSEIVVLAMEHTIDDTKLVFDVRGQELVLYQAEGQIMTRLMEKIQPLVKFTTYKDPAKHQSIIRAELTIIKPRSDDGSSTIQSGITGLRGEDSLS